MPLCTHLLLFVCHVRIDVYGVCTHIYIRNGLEGSQIFMKMALATQTINAFYYDEVSECIST